MAERLVRKDQSIVIGAIALIVVLAGIYTVNGVGMQMSALEMTRMALPIGDQMQMGRAIYWTPSYAILIVLMWWIMMIAMMTPSAAPTILLFAALKRHGNDRDRVPLFSAMFLSGYLMIWAFFAIIATSLQWLLGSLGLVSSAMMTVSSATLAGAVLLAAGIYQFSNLKNACLKHCRSPAIFLAEHNRPRAMGALRTGAHHGVYCLGCCWALMALLFVGGIMNLYWIVGLAIYVVAEKYIPNGALFSKITGGILILGGAYYLIQAVA